ncbi:Benzoate 4-monooxygenase 3 [Zalerion maritima]|uniref:Benzoate 4-monooxygenase bphA n=1 Tax=Zalerion maritima TaxID=339359 RepID=A0AAD5S2H2_9PEZI|nr:Benzoate 4-monooxygenase 3 [Zalerion maritima]
MALFEHLLTPWALGLLPALLVVYYIYPYLITYRALKNIPAPFPAQFTNIWLLSTARRGKRHEIVDDVHKKLGTVVRIQPNHVSIAADEAIPAIYGHGNGFLKADFYDSFVSIRRGLFNTRSRLEHARKRKIVSHTFSAKSVAQFEPYIHKNLEIFVQQWDSLIATSPHVSGKGGAKTAHLDCLNWFNYLAFDAIGDLAFGAPFGMLSRGEDIAEIRASPTSKPIYASAVEILNRRGEVSATLGCLPGLKAWAKWLPDPFFSQGMEAIESLAGIAIARVKMRLENPPPEERLDLLTRLIQGRDEKGQPLGREELTAEALTQLIAGSDTTSNGSCALLYHVVRTPGVFERLRKALDEAIPADVEVPTFEMVKNIDYLGWVINEALRRHSTSGIGLPREVPPESPGVTIHGHFFPAGTVLSVPTYTIHHDKGIWGEDAEDFRPERWENVTTRQKNAFIPFSFGPRACIGRNVAEMELKLIVATWARRYDVVLRQGVMETREGFLRKPLALKVGISRREVE